MITRLEKARVACVTLFALSVFTFMSSSREASAQSADASASTEGSAKAHASGTSVSVKLEPGIAFPLSSPQSDEFGVGGGGFAKLGIGVLPVLDLQATAGFIGFSGKPTTFTKGQLVSVTMLAAGGRLQRPHEDGGLSPWVDLDLGFVQTGDLSRFGYAVGGGVQFPLNEARSTWLGPFVRFVQIASGEKPNINSDDARMLLAGVTLEFEVVGKGAKDTDKDGIPDTEDKCPTKPGTKEWQGCPDSDGDGIPDHEDKCPNDPGPAENQGCPGSGDQDGDGVPDAQDKCPKVAGPKENKGCPDSDGDSINDADDQCPNVKGEPDNKGCPRYKQVVVKDSKIEISQKIFFAFNQATILPKSFDILDEVAQALKDAPALRVRIEGHTDATGSVEHNLALSEARASAVREYMIGQGITPERLESKGYGPTLPLESNATAEGRERNRRVEFVILNK